jgi:hypothetical protein
MDWLKHFQKLPGPLLLTLGICVVAGAFLLTIDPPQILAFLAMLVLSLVMAGWLYVLDGRREAEAKRREVEEGRRREAEGTAKALRQVVEFTISEGGEQRDLWTRPMLQLPLKESVIDKVFQVFDRAIPEASQALSQFLPNVEPSKVRANVFLPTSEGARDGDVCNLIIPRHDLAAPNGLQRNMHKGDERSITFRPNQGATGRVFVERRAVGVLTHPAWLNEEDKLKRKEIERWIYVRLHPETDLSKPGDSLRTEKGKSQFEMTDFQNRRVAERMAWIISMPIFLRIDDTLEVVGVFNVDCLEYQVKPYQLRLIYYRVAPFAGVLAGVLRRLPTDRVAIFRFRE